MGWKGGGIASQIMYFGQWIGNSENVAQRLLASVLVHKATKQTQFEIFIGISVWYAEFVARRAGLWR